ncbi:MAG: NAD(P)H-dependent oxidoreductase [Firmicutes bacterium]|nr:NAD(P)H-dependent oxidoreductase [Bacillota bacterium]
MITVVRLGYNRMNCGRLDRVLAAALAGREYTIIDDIGEFLIAVNDQGLNEILTMMPGAKSLRLLFAVHVPENGYVPAWHELMAWFMNHDLPRGTVGAVLVEGEGPLFTKGIARKLVFSANKAGCTFPGKPLVEATGDLYNFNTLAKIRGLDNYSAYEESAVNLVDKLENFVEQKIERPNILAIHASNRRTSNSLMLWNMLKVGLVGRADIEEISIRNGDIIDCRGCEFDTCKHYGENGECFYGGLVVEQVYPAIIDCTHLVLICPNYNDSVGANMSAMFNRLTALFYNNDFSEKRIYSLIVSGYSGSELLAEQIIGAMNLNKGFMLPPKFAMMETANDPRSIIDRAGVAERAEDMAKAMLL